MIFFLTGGMGAGKTLNALKQVRDLQLQTGRPVCYTARIELMGPALDFGWKQIEFKEWEKEPDGTIFLIDEAHKDLPVRGGIGAPPSYVQNLAEHRHHGYDFFLVTQHPKNVDSFVRRLVGNPGWHKHLKRRAGAPLVTVLKWDSVYENCEKNSSGDSAEISHVAYPKEVFGWYKSATIHTAKFKLPKSFWMFIGGLVVVAVLLFSAYRYMRGDDKTKDAKKDKETPSLLDAVTGSVLPKPAHAPESEKRTLTASEYVATHVPRIEGLPHTAPRYDELTKPRQVPYPAACLQMGRRCTCFSQQATPLDVSAEICQQIVAKGVYLDFLPTEAERRREQMDFERSQSMQGGAMAGVDRRSAPGIGTPVAVRELPMPGAHEPDWAERKAAYNAQVTSRLKPGYPGR